MGNIDSKTFREKGLKNASFWVINSTNFCGGKDKEENCIKDRGEEGLKNACFWVMKENCITGKKSLKSLPKFKLWKIAKNHYVW